jgi:hypothetical protein
MDNKTGIALGIVAIAAAIGVYVIAKKVNYNLQYEKMVKETIVEMVKPEALK